MMSPKSAYLAAAILSLLAATSSPPDSRALRQAPVGPEVRLQGGAQTPRMRVLVDTSVWSLALRKAGPADHPAVEKLAAMLQSGEDIFLTGLILQEILQAFRSEVSFRKVSRHLEPFPLLDLDVIGSIAAAALHRKCDASGVSASTADCQIAAAAVRHECLLLSADRDFERISRLSDLNLA